MRGHSLTSHTASDVKDLLSRAKRHLGSEIVLVAGELVVTPAAKVSSCPIRLFDTFEKARSTHRSSEALALEEAGEVEGGSPSVLRRQETKIRP